MDIWYWWIMIEMGDVDPVVSRARASLYMRFLTPRYTLASSDGLVTCHPFLKSDIQGKGNDDVMVHELVYGNHGQHRLYAYAE